MFSKASTKADWKYIETIQARPKRTLILRTDSTRSVGKVGAPKKVTSTEKRSNLKRSNSTDLSTPQDTTSQPYCEIPFRVTTFLVFMVVFHSKVNAEAPGENPFGIPDRGLGLGIFT